MKRYILLSPGPVNVKEKVRKALLKPDACHREQEFADVILSCRNKLLKAFGVRDDYEVVFFSGSGTLAVEAALISCVPPRKKILVINNGVYAQRLATIARRHGIGVVNLKFNITSKPNLKSVERKIRDAKDVAVVAMVHHETSTGLLNPVHEIGWLCRKYAKLYLLDSISALGGEELDIKGAKVDLCAGVANKCIEAIPGVSFVLIRKDSLPKMRRIRPRSLYMDIPFNLKLQRRGETAFTPAVQSFYAFEAALEELIKEGVQERIWRYRNTAAILRRGFEALRLKYLVSPLYHSNTVTALLLPEGVAYKELHDYLKEKGFIIYAGQAELKERIFRVANMGQIDRESILRFLECLKAALKR